MRKFLILFCFICNYSIAQDVHILGNGMNLKNGEKIVLKQWTKDGWSIKDSTIVLNSTFQFTIAEQSSFALISSEKYESEVFLHGDTIRLSLDSIPTVNGDELVLNYATIYRNLLKKERIKNIVIDRCHDVLDCEDLENQVFWDTQQMICSEIRDEIKNDLGLSLLKRHIEWIKAEDLIAILEHADSTRSSFPPIPLDYDLDFHLSKTVASIRTDSAICNTIRKKIIPYQEFLQFFEQRPWKQLEGAEPVDLQLVDMNGGKLTLLDVLRRSGKSTFLLEFWASWCGPCHLQFDIIEKVRQQHPEIEVIGISLDDYQQVWIDDIKENDLKWSQYRLQNKADVNSSYKVFGIPHTVMIENNTITFSGHGEIHSEILKKK